jgi:hypothetical protein
MPNRKSRAGLGGTTALDPEVARQYTAFLAGGRGRGEGLSIEMDLKELALIDPEKHWYYQSKLFLLRFALGKWPTSPRRIVDVGAGSGFLSRSLANFESGDEVTCVDPNYDTEWAEEQGLLRFVRCADPDDVARANVLLFIDVIEHVQDDVALLVEYASAAPPNTLVLIAVPAFMSLWSPHDVFLEHFRRYRLPGLRDTVERAGLEVIHQQYLFASIFPAVWAVRRLRQGRAAASDLESVPSLLNATLNKLLSVEHRVFWNRFFGVSAFIVAKTPAPEALSA